MKCKVSELSGAALDWAVTKCHGYTDDRNSWLYNATIEEVKGCTYHPSIHWAQGGPIIDAEGITIRRFCILTDEIKWGAYEIPSIRKPKPSCVYGPTPLVAAMRCYVASKVGEYVELPDGL